MNEVSNSKDFLINIAHPLLWGLTDNHLQSYGISANKCYHKKLLNVRGKCLFMGLDLNLLKSMERLPSMAFGSAPVFHVLLVTLSVRATSLMAVTKNNIGTYCKWVGLEIKSESPEQS